MTVFYLVKIENRYLLHEHTLALKVLFHIVGVVGQDLFDGHLGAQVLATVDDAEASSADADPLASLWARQVLEADDVEAVHGQEQRCELEEPVLFVAVIAATAAGVGCGRHLGQWLYSEKSGHLKDCAPPVHLRGSTGTHGKAQKADTPIAPLILDGRGWLLQKVFRRRAPSEVGAAIYEMLCL